MVCKGRLSWKVHTPTKQARFGMNLFELRELKPGYIRNFIIYVWWEVDGVLCVTKWVNVVKQGATVTIATCLCAVPCCQTYHKVVDYQKSGSEN